MQILNLGCGSKTHPALVNIDWSIHLRIARNPLARALAPLIAGKERGERIVNLPESVMVHNLAKGIPFADGTADGVYHSHVIEHLGRQIVPGFLAEIYRVLKPGGMVRIVAPDMEHLCRRYLDSLDRRRAGEGVSGDHEEYLAEIVEQMTRIEADGTSRQKPLRRFIENLLLGDARRRGEVHQWMYDELTLSAILAKVGFTDIQRATFDSSRIDQWSEYRLDLNDEGGEYKPGSLYIEGRKPQ
jgi:predicted SAM-dependent methyltransferase